MVYSQNYEFYKPLYLTTVPGIANNNKGTNLGIKQQTLV